MNELPELTKETYTREEVEELLRAVRKETAISVVTMIYKAEQCKQPVVLPVGIARR